MEEQIRMLNEKMDKILLLLETPPKKEPVENEWYVEKYSTGSFLIKFTFNEKFKSIVKDLGGKWVVGKKGWMFPLSEKEVVCKNLSENFKEWKFTEM